MKKLNYCLKTIISSDMFKPLITNETDKMILIVFVILLATNFIECQNPIERVIYCNEKYTNRNYTNSFGCFIEKRDYSDRYPNC